MVDFAYWWSFIGKGSAPAACSAGMVKLYPSCIQPYYIDTISTLPISIQNPLSLYPACLPVLGSLDCLECSVLPYHTYHTIPTIPYQCPTAIQPYTHTAIQPYRAVWYVCQYNIVQHSVHWCFIIIQCSAVQCSAVQ